MTCNRRTFLQTSAAATAALSLAPLAATPRRALAASPLEVTDGKVAIKLSDLPELSGDYTSTKVKVAGVGKLLLTHLEGDRYLTVSSKCTHQGCQVKWSPDEKTFQCPCHESAFDLNGQPTGGPADKPLPLFPTEVKDGVALITIPEGAADPSDK
jgi:Rieske Fe-S protein